MKSESVNGNKFCRFEFSDERGGAHLARTMMLTELEHLLDHMSKSTSRCEDAAVAQCVIFCGYNEFDKLRLRASADEFELATRQAGNGVDRSAASNPERASVPRGDASLAGGI